jgi:hypothetical protein
MQIVRGRRLSLVLEREADLRTVYKSTNGWKR